MTRNFELSDHSVHFACAYVWNTFCLVFQKFLRWQLCHVDSCGGQCRHVREITVDVDNRSIYHDNVVYGSWKLADFAISSRWHSFAMRVLCFAPYSKDKLRSCMFALTRHAPKCWPVNSNTKLSTTCVILLYLIPCPCLLGTQLRNSI